MLQQRELRLSESARCTLSLSLSLSLSIEPFLSKRRLFHHQSSNSALCDHEERCRGIFCCCASRVASECCNLHRCGSASGRQTASARASVGLLLLSEIFCRVFFSLQKRFRKFCSSFAAVVERANGLLQKESRREESSSGWWRRRCSRPCVQMRFQRLYRRDAAATDVPGVQRNCRLPDGDCAFLLLLFFLRNTTLLPSLSLLLQQRWHHSGQGVSHPSFFLQGNSSSLHSALLDELFLGFGFQVRSSSKTPVTLPSISEERVKLLQMSQLLLLIIFRSMSSS